MANNSGHVTGFVLGLGAAAVGFYVYKKNQTAIDTWLREHGIDLVDSGAENPDSMSLKDLVLEKERLEDIIAEREMAEAEAAAAAAGEAEKG